MKRSWIIKFIILIPIINALADIFTNYFSAEAINPGNIRGIILFMFIIYLLLSKPIWNNKTILFTVYLSYLFLLVLLSSNLLGSLTFYTKYFISLMMLPLGFYFINDYENLKKLNTAYLVALSIMLLNIAVANIFEIGSSDYLDDSLYFGTSRVNITKNISVIILLYPIIIYQYKYSKRRTPINILFILALIITFLGLKRSALLTIIIGILVIFIILKDRRNLIVSFAFGAIFVLIFWPIFGNTFEARYRAREDVIEATSLEEYEEQARYNEMEIVWDAFKNGSLTHKLIGSEIFNDREFFQVHRMLHMDYSIMLNGSGLIGILFYTAIILYLFLIRSKYFRTRNMYAFGNLLNATYTALLFALLIMGIAGSVYAIGLRTEIFLYMGAILGIMSNYDTHLINERRIRENSA